MNLDTLCTEAMKRLQQYINRAAAQHLYHLGVKR